MTVDVVIPAWNSRALLEPCLTSLVDQERLGEVVVVDNGSTDGTAAWLADADADPDVDAPLRTRVISFPTNRGFAVAVNAGVAVATAPHVLLLNADCVVVPGALATLTQALHADPGLLAVQPLVVQVATGPERIYSAGQELLRDGRAQERGHGALASDVDARAGEVFGVCGAACLVRRDAFLALGGYRERFFAFHEDVELNARARLLGWRFALEPSARVRHVGNASWQRQATRPDAFNAGLVARNRLATSLEVLPARRLPGALVVELASTLLATTRGTGRAVLAGKLRALAWAPWALRERRRLRAGRRAGRLQPWLTAPNARLRPVAAAARPVGEED